MAIFDRGCDWHCDYCGAYMNNQSGFTARTGRWVCSSCGTENDVSDYNIIYDDDSSENDDDIPEGCAACGGPYPNCTSSCPLFDD